MCNETLYHTLSQVLTAVITVVYSKLNLIIRILGKIAPGQKS